MNNMCDPLQCGVKSAPRTEVRNDGGGKTAAGRELLYDRIRGNNLGFLLRSHGIAHAVAGG